MSKCTCIEQNRHEQDCPNRPLRPGDYVSYISVTGTTSYTFPKLHAAGLGVAGRRILVQSNPACPSATLRDATPAPVPVLYDGLTAEQCLELYVESQRYDSEPSRKLLTPARLGAARELWSAQLRARRDAAKERERRSVTYCEVDSDD